MMKRSVLVDKEDNAQKTKSDDAKALKRKRRQEAPPMKIKSSEGTQSTELLKVQETVRAAQEAGEGFNEMSILSLDTVRRLETVRAPKVQETIRATQEAGEGFNKVSISSLDAVTDLV